MLLARICNPIARSQRHHGIVQPARSLQTVRRLAISARAEWVLAGMVGVASLLFVSSPVHLDSEDDRIRRRDGSSAFGTASESSSHFSYSYYESSMNQGEEGGESRSLRLQEKTHLPGTQTGIYRYDTAQIASNDTPGSGHVEAVLPYPAGYWGLFALLGGRNGPSTSAWLCENIIYAVGGALVDLYSRLCDTSPSRDTPPTPSDDAIARTLNVTFKHLDREVVYGSVDKALSNSSHYTRVDLLALAQSGSSALLGFYDSYTQNLHVALTGDSRAVLGRRMQNKAGDVVYQVRVLTVEQDAGNLAEEYRLNARHPGEAVVYNGHVLSGGPTRSFGDATYKWDADTRRQLQDASIIGPTPSDVRTPPYLTAEPEVTSTAVQPGDFLIMGTRGVWDRLGSEEAVGLVGIWLDEQWRRQGERGRTRPAPSLNDFLVAPLVIEDRAYKHEDRNAAAHLLRNALSRRAGPRAEQASDSSVDSLTATVIFFADDQTVKHK
ncbi:protein serine/threonine phosphatase 2C [Daedalea quercina L-15889]|uniref:Protein serine/threonine phosphatase 2C n=1 Tax=Daedalea quercina L-15889 TaxID=1314783 RepID=A0A165TXD2_9APHY|nr:protein serine/threonine phosphatase 2C [Daedalea quercina L-15889]